MKAIFFTKILSIILILSCLLSFSACQPPDYGDAESSSEVSSSEVETEDPTPNPFGSSVPYNSGTCFGTYIYEIGITEFEGESRRMLLRINRETNQSERACIHKNQEKFCVFCDPECDRICMGIRQGILYTVYHEIEGDMVSYIAAFQYMESGETVTMQLPYADGVLSDSTFLRDDYLYYVSVRYQEHNSENPGDRREYEYSRIAIGETEREIFTSGFPIPDQGNGKGYTTFDNSIFEHNLQTGEKTEIFNASTLGAQQLTWQATKGYRYYFTVLSPGTVKYFDLYFVDVLTGECEMVASKITIFCIMEEGIYYRTPGEYESKYTDADGNHPKRFERDLYRCDLDGSNAEVVFSDPDMVFMDLIAVIDGYAYGEFRIMTSAKDKKIARFALHLATGTYQEIVDTTATEE